MSTMNQNTTSLTADCATICNHVLAIRFVAAAAAEEFITTEGCKFCTLGSVSRLNYILELLTKLDLASESSTRNEHDMMRVG